MTKDEIITRKAILEAVMFHPKIMSPTLLAYMLTGETIGRMMEKGLNNSAFFGLLNMNTADLELEIAKLVSEGYLNKAGGFYPALSLDLRAYDEILILRRMEINLNAAIEANKVKIPVLVNGPYQPE